MKYTIIINQLVLSKTKLDVTDGAILDYIGFLCGSTNSKIEKERLVDGRWTWIDLGTMGKQMPMLCIKSVGAFTRRIQKIADAGFIETTRSAHQRLYARLTPKYDELLIQINSPQAQAIDINQQSYCSTSTDKDNSNKEDIDKEAAPSQEVLMSKLEKKTAPANRLAGIEWLTMLDKDDIMFFKERYPELPEEAIRREAQKAYTWLKRNPDKGRQSQTRGFLSRWLSKTVSDLQSSYAYKKPTIGGYKYETA